ncbi:MAG: PVC-type heme-binding CxxCH protein [Pirellulales bacterium]
MRYHLCVGLTVLLLPLAAGAEPRKLQVPEGFEVEQVAGPPLVDRPITAAFDERGRLYVADSSGSNDPVEQQLAEKPHRIVRLDDVDGDGRFERSTVFADRMMFPEGTMFFDGSLYVSAPPSIWKLTDTNDDGVADERVEWFQGGTLTGCANDLHGPYLGPDGWIYWCKGAFAEQTHEVNGREWKSKAAHIFRCRPDGTGLEPVMTGGMDNPVDVAFTPEGEPIFSSTFLVSPGNGAGQRDGLAHAVYGGVFGKENSAVDGHPRTGDLLPIMVHLGAAAPCGLERYDTSAFGDEYRDNLFCCEFNHRKVSRHVLHPDGSTLRAESTPFVVSEDVDFHPTDVVVDADGSLIVVDTGGWYKLCCPTSQLWKPDVLGGIYRVTKTGAKPATDPRGFQIDWSKQTPTDLWKLLSDDRSVVRSRAVAALTVRRESAELKKLLGELDKAPPSAPVRAVLNQTWALVRIDTAESRELVRRALKHDDEEAVRRAALHGVSLHRDAHATERLVEILANNSPANRRVAAEAIGRIGDEAAVPHLLSAAETADDRMLQHAVCYALLEIGDAEATRIGLNSKSEKARVIAMTALDQMPDGGLQATDVVPLLDSRDDTARAAADWIVRRHPEWGQELAAWLGQQLEQLTSATADESSVQSLQGLLTTFASDGALQELMAGSVLNPQLSMDARQLVLQAMARARPAPPPQSWLDALTSAVDANDPALLALAVATARAMTEPKPRDEKLDRALLRVVEDAHIDGAIRIEALATVVAGLNELSPQNFDLLLGALSAETPVPVRSAAADALSRAPLSAEQLAQLCGVIESAGPLELHRLLAPFARSTDEMLAATLLTSLKNATAISALRIDVVREVLKDYGPAVQQQIDELHGTVNVDLSSQRKKVAELQPKMAGGDVRRGHGVFHSTKAACSACHKMGYAGGLVGPDLTRIGEVRTERDLLEAVLFPSLSFVRSYEPSLVLTTDGRSVNGVIRDESSQGLLVATGPDQEVRIPLNEVDELHPSTVSVMPAGLDQQLSVQELADLIAFLKEARGR